MTTVAILGGGQLGRMLALAGHDLGLRCRLLDPQSDCPAAPVAEVIQAPFDDAAALMRLTAGATVATVEREHLPMAAMRQVATQVMLHPSPAALEAVQSRIDQRRFLGTLGLAQPDLAFPTDRASFHQALDRLGLPVVVKAARGGYDGRAQRLVRLANEADAAWNELSPSGVVIEAFIPFDEELSLLAVRGRDGTFGTWPLVRTYQVEGVLALAHEHPQGMRWQAQAVEMSRRIAHALDYVGVFCVELFRVGDRLLVNEIAPRVHNSGHWTSEGSECSQFDNHLRAILGLPLGSTRSRGASALINVIGQLPERGAVLAIPGLHWHDYDKRPRAGRKLGHLTITASTQDELHQRLGQLHAAGLAIPESACHG